MDLHQGPPTTFFLGLLVHPLYSFTNHPFLVQTLTVKASVSHVGIEPQGCCLLALLTFPMPYTQSTPWSCAVMVATCELLGHIPNSTHALDIGMLGPRTQRGFHRTS